VGGSTRIPKIQSLLSDFFEKPVYTGIDPDEAVAKGAAIQAANLSGQHNGELDGVILLDAVSLSMGIETVGGIMTKIVPRDSFLPTRKSQTFSTHVDNQSTVTILVFEGERGMTKDNHLLGKFELTGIPPAPRGVPQIEVTFDVDVNNVLEVSAVDKGTGKAEKITITAVQGQLSKEQVDQMAKEAEMYAEEDKKQVERIQARNGLESYLHNLKNTLDEEGGGRELSISPAEKKELRDIVEETLDWLEEHQDAEMEEFKVKAKEIEAVANPLMIKAYGGAGDRSAEAEEDFYDEDL
jgi:molecular chaperone DnaK (HSP70)